jgi:hypothetical protein
MSQSIWTIYEDNSEILCRMALTVALVSKWDSVRIVLVGTIPSDVLAFLDLNFCLGLNEIVFIRQLNTMKSYWRL